MHIAIFVDFHDSAIGGVTTSVRGQRKGLEDLGHKVTIVCLPRLVMLRLIRRSLLFRPFRCSVLMAFRWLRRQSAMFG